MATKVENIWEPQKGPQTIFIRCHIEDVLYGGARGGGKTDGALGDWLYHLLTYKQYAKGIFVRPTMPELEDAIKRAQELFQDVGDWKEQKKTFEFYGGGSLKFRYLKNRTDAQAYQGHAYSWIEIEEAGNYPTPDVPDLMFGTLRSANQVVCKYRQTANPGGPGHNWIKARYIDPAPPFTPFTAKLEIGHNTAEVQRIFIPAKLSDNKILVENDPGYEDRLLRAAAGQKWLYEAWRHGNWDIVAGGMFDDIWNRDIHVIKPFKIPSSWTITRAYDWGSSKPFSVGWWAISDGTQVTLAGGKQRSFPPGTFFRIAEWYGWNGQPNQGLRMLEKDIAEGIKQREKQLGYKITSGPADTSIFDEENGNSYAKEHKALGVIWKKADKKPGSRVAGWMKIRQLLLSSLQPKMEEPGLFIFDNCTQWIRTVPTLPRDDKKMDDVDTNAEDHIGDETRYMVRFKSKTARMGSIGGF